MGAAKVGAIAAGITIAAWVNHKDVMQDIPVEGNERNIIFPFMPDTLKYVDKDGNIRHFYFKVRVDPNLALIYKTFEYGTKHFINKSGLGQIDDVNLQFPSALKNLGPENISMPPLPRMWDDYRKNVDDYTGKQIVNKPLPWPKSRVEGAESITVSPLAKEVGAVTGLSPKRLDVTARDIIPYNNEFVTIMGKGFALAHGDDVRDMTEPWYATLAKIPGVNRIIGITVPHYSDRAAGVQISEDLNVETIVRDEHFKSLMENYLSSKDSKERNKADIAVTDYIYSKTTGGIPVFDEELRKMLKNRKAFYEKTEGMPESSFWRTMESLGSDEAKAKYYVERFDKASPEMKVRLQEGQAILKASGKLFTSNLNMEIAKVRFEGK
jgi:hypothetical protein